MSINKNNIQEYFNKYLAGILDKNETKELLQYIEQHIDEIDIEQLNITNNLFSFSSIDKIKFNDKKILYKPHEYQFIEYIENLMPDDVKKTFEQKIFSDPLLEKELKLFQYTKIKPDTSIIYPDKNKLKKKKRRLLTFKYTAAACFVIFLLLFIWIKFQDNTNPAIVSNLNPISFNKKRNISNITDTFKQENFVTLNNKPISSNKKDSFTKHYSKKNIQNQPIKNEPLENASIIENHIVTDKISDTSIVIINSSEVNKTDTSNNDQNQTIIIHSIKELETEQNDNETITKTDKKIPSWKKIINIITKNKIYIYTNQCLVIGNNNKEFLTLNIPKIEIKNNKTVTFNDTNSSNDKN